MTGISTTYPLSHNLFAIHHINAYEEGDTLIVDTIQLFPSFVPCGTAFKMLTLNHTVLNPDPTALSGCSVDPNPNPAGARLAQRSQRQSRFTPDEA